MAAYNAEKYVSDAIESVIAQSFPDWELLIVDDGSTDRTGDLIRGFHDDRIVRIRQANRGVSAARNHGLENMRGDYFCFLDADDVLPPRSLEARLARFAANPHASFVDGAVSVRDAHMRGQLRRTTPSLRGDVFSALVRLNESCFFGPTWMIKREAGVTYRFQEGLSHGEDLCFYLSLARNRTYDFVDDEVLWYRKGHTSAMSNVDGLKNGYRHFYGYAKALGAETADLKYTRRRIRRIVFLSYWFDQRSPAKAVMSLFEKWP